MTRFWEGTSKMSDKYFSETSRKWEKQEECTAHGAKIMPWAVHF